MVAGSAARLPQSSSPRTEASDAYDPVVEADQLRSARRGPRRWFWVSMALVACLIVTLAVFTVPVRQATATGIEFGAVTSSNTTYLLGSYTLWPPASTCVGPSSYLCTNIWVAFNWSTLTGQPMNFRFIVVGQPGSPIYNATGVAFGGFSMTCDTVHYFCEDPFYISTNDTSGQGWFFHYRVVYDYLSTVPVL